MGRAIDLERRKKRPTLPEPTTQRRARGNSGLLGIVGLMALIFVLAFGRRPQAGQLIEQTTLPDTQIPLTTTPTPSTIEPVDSFGPSEPTLSPVPTLTTPTVTPTESPAATLDKSQLTIRILNGSTTPGVASKLKSQLQTQGFIIRTVALAKTKQPTTTVYYQTGQEAGAKLLAEALSNRTVDLKENSDLTQPDLILIIVGNK